MNNTSHNRARRLRQRRRGPAGRQDRGRPAAPPATAGRGMVVRLNTGGTPRQLVRGGGHGRAGSRDDRPEPLGERSRDRRGREDPARGHLGHGQPCSRHPPARTPSPPRLTSGWLPRQQLLRRRPLHRPRGLRRRGRREPDGGAARRQDRAGGLLEPGRRRREPRDARARASTPASASAASASTASAPAPSTRARTWRSSRTGTSSWAASAAWPPTCWSRGSRRRATPRTP